ncbi:type I polyketide synthase [Moorena producens JHB]|uniref:Type I polyketide synthase n=2 Tax=Cyanophyceae TaxID=3028117 RepID=A0A1D9GBE1_MOOP1|nr:type I polyketide synthase [Moorena producens]AAS98782.1 JamK [Lyngbya majuscula]AOY84949.1 type I polyketide synthase [Moorena producens JHB]
MKDSSHNLEQLSPLQKSFLVIERLKSKVDTLEKSQREPIAIIGMGCRFPGGASTPEAFWDILQNGVDAITEVPQDRWRLDDYYDPDPDSPGKVYTRYGGFLNKLQEFDSNFFGISPKEAIHLDPQQRLLLEVSWEALENSGKNPQQLQGSPTGVFIGICGNDYTQRIFSQGPEQFDAYVATGNAHSTASGRISYILGLIGPNLAVDTACSSSLVSIHLACSSLRNQECNLALCGGVNLLLSQEFSINFSKARMLSFDGRCKTFDTSADGFVRGEGCGIVVLKRLSDAVADQDNILAVIRGSAINQDGDTSGLTVPNGPSQQSVIRQALANGEVDPTSVSYLEAHGTGTALGDPIEVEAIGTVFGKTHSVEQPLIIGSVKTNIGHTEGAAGIAGLLKLVLQLQHQQIAPSLHFNQPNPYINWSQLPVKVSTQLTPWQTNGKSRIAGVSSFGFSGTNAHVILEEAPREGNRQQATGNSEDYRKGNSEDYLERSVHLLTLSAKTETAFDELVSSYQNYLPTHPELGVGDICYTANTGRAHFNHRLAVVAQNQQELVEKLRQHQEGEEVAGIFSGKLPNNTTAPKIALLFTGQGSQYVNMGRELYQQASTFREAINQCEDILSRVETFQETSLREILYPADDSSGSSLLNQTAYTQPCLFALEYALCQLWQSWGIKPNVVMGHSVGEYVAATVAGVFSLEDGLKLIAARGRLMQQLPAGGEMVSVMANEAKILETLNAMSRSDKVAIAAINGPQSIVISGESEAVRAIATNLESLGIKTKQLQVSHAFHSPLMEPMLAEFEAVANQITYHQPRILLISNVTGKLVGEEITSAKYWVNHVRQPVRFAQSMTTLHQQGYELFLEIGPKPVLLGMGRQCLLEEVSVWLPSLRPGKIPLPSPLDPPPVPLNKGEARGCYAFGSTGKPEDAALLRGEWQQMLSSLGQLYVQGVKIDWLGFDKDYARQKVALPTYPFQRERYWVETKVNGNHQHSSWTSENSNTAIVNLLSQGETATLAQQLEQAAKFSPEQLKLLPEILEVLAKQHQQQLAAATIKDWFYQLQWQPLPQTQSQTSIKPSHWLIFADNTGVAEKLAQKLQEQGHECSLVHRADNYQQLAAGRYQLNPSAPEEFEQLQKAILETSQLSLSKVIHLWSLDAPATEDLTLDSLEQTQLWGCGSVLHLLQSVLKTTNVLQLWLVTRGAQSVLSNTEKLTVAASPLWGLGRVVSLENSQLWGGLVDLDPQTPEDEVEKLLQLLVNNLEEDHLALRGEQTYVARLVQQSPQASEQPLSLSSDATYLITGGLGALGLHTAQWLVEKGARNIVLTGRSAPSATAQEIIEQLEQAGAQVSVLLGDISVEQDVAQIIEEIQISLPTLKGVIHAAGVIDDATLQQISWGDFTKVMAPKVRGTWHLHQFTQDLPLDFFVCFSSMASLIGSPGQGNYAAANAFMDALAHYRRGRGLSGLSINWGAWSYGGMAASLAVEHQNRIHNLGISTIDPAQGIYVLEQLLRNQALTGQVGVISVQWSLLAQQWSNLDKSSLLWKLLQQDELQQQDTIKQKLNQEILEKLEKASVDSRQEILSKHIRGQVAKVLGFNSSQLPQVNLGFMEMGMDSLTTVELKNRLQAQLGIALPGTVAMEYPTIETLSQYILKEVMGWQSVADSENNLPELEEVDVDDQILPVIENISEEEFEALAAQQLEKIKSML